MDRRRGIIGSYEGGSGPIIPDGYVKNGLVFFLDGIQLRSADSWSDIVGGKTFTLNNCSLNAAGTGIVFNGSSSYGELPGVITSDWANETIEMAFNASSTNVENKTVLCQPYLNNSVGISMRLGYEAASTPRFAMGIDGVTRNFYYYRLTNTKNIISGNADRVIVNGVMATSTHSTYYSKNTKGITYLGAHATSGNPTGFFNGTIHAVRIYNRKLTQAEMIQNQEADKARYGLA